MTVQTAEDRMAIANKTVAAVGDIATLPEVTVKIIEVVEDPNGTAHELHAVIKRDPALSAKVLKVVNSAFYGLPGQVASVDRAIVLLGLSAVKNIAIAASMAKMFKGKEAPPLFDPKDLWKHSVAVGVAAKKISEAAGNVAGGDEMFLAGLIHDIGLLVERQAFPNELADVVEQVKAGKGSFLDLEVEIVGASHQDFGSALTTKWKFPRHLHTGVTFHHNPELLTGDMQRIGMILRCADILSCQEEMGFDLVAQGDEFTEEMLDVVGITVDQLVEVRDVLEPGLREAEAVLSSNH